MAEGLTRSSLRTPPRALGTESGRMYREARKLERKGFSGAAQQVAAAAAQQKLTNERPGFLSADTAIEEQKLQLEAAKKKAAIASGMVPQDTRRGLFEDIRAAAGQGLTGAEGAKQLAGFRSRATQLGVTPEAFDRTVGGKLGVALPATAPTTPAVTPTPTATTAATTTPPVVAPAATTPAAPRVGMIEGRPASAVNRSLRESPTTQPGTIDIDPGFARLSGASGDVAEFLKGVRKLTSPEGGDMFRGAAVDEMNRQRMAAGKAPLKREAVLRSLLVADKIPAYVEKEKELFDFLGAIKPSTPPVRPPASATPALTKPSVEARIAARKESRRSPVSAYQY